MTVHHRKLKEIRFTLSTESSPSSGDDGFACQISSWQVVNNTPDGERIYTFCPDGEDREEPDPDYALELTFFADWREDGISDFLTAHDLQRVYFVLDHHPDTDSWVRWSGQCIVKAPTAGGEVRGTETNTITLPIIGKPEYERVPYSPSGSA